MSNHTSQCDHDSSDAIRADGDGFSSAWECIVCGFVRPFDDSDYEWCNASRWTPPVPEGMSKMAWLFTPRESRLAHYAR